MSAQRIAIVLTVLLTAPLSTTAAEPAVARKPAGMGGLRVGVFDWPQWGGTSHRNNTPPGKNIPITWDVKTGKNIKWKAELGSETYGAPVVANGRVFIGTNNGRGYVKRYPPAVDLGCLLCFDEQTGRFLWQHSAEKLASGRVNDWPEQGICATPLVDGDRLWIVTNRCDVVCLDTAGFHDGENDGPYKSEPNNNRDESDIVWKFDMMQTLNVFPHNMSSCSITTDGKRLFICTSNGVAADHKTIPSPKAPSFLCLDKNTGTVLWTDKSPGKNILYGQYASPTYFVAGNQPQVVFPGGDGWLYSFDPRGDGKGKSKLLWKFDTNPKGARWTRDIRCDRNSIVGNACFYAGRLYIANGQIPEHGEGLGHLWCINPAKKLDGSDISPTLVISKDGKRVPHRRIQAIDPGKEERVIENPDSAVVWHYSRINRSTGTPVIRDDILYIADIAGLVHCLNAKTGAVSWTYDMFSAAWGSGMIVDGKVYFGDEDGDVAIFPLSANPAVALRDVGGRIMPALGEINMSNAMYSTPVVANNVLFIANKNTLYAISPGGK